MTQLVQLQGIKDNLEEAGYSVFAISNDPVEILTEFAAKHDITFPLLSDSDSAVIRAFGIMNQLIRPDEGQSMRWYGIAYPGTYYVDANMMVTDKDFHQHHARRASGSSVLARVLGRE
ncbi:MAG: peroxiredoxin family protein, partial [Acidimicrobiales bacterium]|nr:peroxiredoxin family protein [Acidimicrobiales bacterium]